jgi:type I restriction enzyme S subunit
VVTETREGITDEAVHSVMPAPALAGTILASFKLTIGRVAMAGQDLHHNEAIASLPVHRPDLVTPGYLRLVLPGAMAREQTNAAVMGAVLNKSKLLDLPIPLAPLEEQKRIVSLLDRAAEIRRRADSARAKARAIIPALFLDMFGHPPADWPMVSIDSLLAHQANAIRTGPFGSQLKHSEFIDSGVPVLGIDNVVENEFKWAKRRFLPPDKYNSFKRFRVFGGDVIVTIMGTTGRVCVTPDDLPECMSTKHLCAFTLNRSLVHPRYIWGTLLFDPAVRAHSRGKANGQIMEGWNMGIVKSICLPLPPLQLQSDFAEQAQRLETTAHALDAAAAKAEAMAAALSAEVFR